ncbi:hypothetical protein LCGC14_0306270 [marine sediment metagenome]|uniref:FCP1 homology domain-containing protein n=1 Tax=marine sediment metagenome TaxID=412755 RepID=A0A0F9WV73_9ZZZZ
MRVKTIAFDLDNTLCSSIRVKHPEDILRVKPRQKWLLIIRELKNRGHKIVIFTSRDSCGKDARKLTKLWLDEHNIPYDSLITNKPHYDIFIGDRLFSSHRDWCTVRFIELWIRYIRSSINSTKYRSR